MTRRPGLSLTEVLVALFIMGIGTIAVLTLFPLGALNMAQAFRDDRCTQGASQADAFLRGYVKEKSDQGKLRLPPPIGEGFYEALTDPDPKKAVSTYLVPVVGPVPSYPVVIDPMGYRARGGTNDTPSPATSRIAWVADNGFGDGTGSAHTSPLQRRSLRSITSRNDATPPRDTASQLPLAIRSCTLLDGFGYDPNTGQPATVGGGTTIDRDLRYNWFWVVQKPDNSSAKATMTVVVFDKRAPGYAPAGVALETVFTPSVAAVGQTLVSFTGSYTANTLPTVQRGGWLLDASVALIDRSKPSTPTVVPFRGTGTKPAAAEAWVRNANFYRVVSVTETAAGIDVELEIPLREDTGRNIPPVTNDPPLQPADRRFIYLSGVAEVFERKDALDLN
jgi:hypothetical protein